MAISNKKAEFSDISQLFDNGWVTNKGTDTASLISPNQFAFSIKCSRAAYTAVNNTTGQKRTMRSLQAAANWISGMNKLMCAVDKVYVKHSQNAVALNSNLSAEAATRIKTVFKTAQDAVDLPKGFRYTAFRTNSEENVVISTLMYTSAKLGATQWVMKSGLMGAFEGEIEEGRRNDIIEHDSWAFQPDYDINRVDSGREDYIEKEADKIYNFRPTGDTPAARDKQAAYWLVGLLSDVLDNILDNPPNRVYEFFLADGLLHKKDLSRLTMVGLLRLLDKGAVTGPEVLKAKPSIWKKLLEKDYITPEQALKSQPEQLAWLTIHNYIPVERALKIDPSITKKLARAGIMIDDVDNSDILTDVDSLIGYVTDGVLTPQKAWTLNDKVLRPLVESGLIAPDAAYKLDPSILNWLLENHYIGREEATRLKPTIKKEMTRKGVDWETLEASINASRKLNADYDYPDEDSEDVFYVAIDDDLVIKVEKHDGRWYESVEWEGEDAREFKTATYMGYLTHDDIKTWIRRDFPNAYIRELSEDEYYDFIEEQEYDDDYDDDDWEDLDSSRHLNASTYEELITRFKAGDYIDDDVSLHTNAKVPMSRGAEPVDTVYLRKEPGEQGKILGFAHNKAGDYSYDLLEAADITNVDLSPYMNGFDITDFEGLLDCLKAAGILRTAGERNASRQLNAGWDEKNLDRSKKLNSSTLYLDPEGDAWEYVRSKDVLDFDGFNTTYTWFQNEDGTRHIFMLTDDEPDPSYADFECESYEEARDWFESYEGFEEDLDSSKRRNTNAAWVDIEPSWHDTYPDEVYGDDDDDYEDEWEPVSDDVINDPDGQMQTTTYFNAREGIYVLMIGDEAPSQEHAETYSTDLSDIEYYIQDWNEQLANLDSSKNLNAGWDYNDYIGWYDPHEQEQEEIDNSWSLRRYKTYIDSEGWQGEYYWFYNTMTGEHIFMADSDEPDPDYADWTTESEEEAAEWFDNYGNDDLDSSRELNCSYDYRWEYVAERWIDDNGVDRHYTLYGDDTAHRYIITYDDGEEEVEPSEDTAIEMFRSYKEAKNYLNSLDSSRQSNGEAQEPANEAAKIALENQIRAKVRAVMTGPDFGYSNDEADSYSKIEVSETDDGRVRVEVRADVTYDGLMQLAEALNPIVQKYDKDSYFDAVTSGVIDAYIENAAQKLNSLDFQSTSWTR